MSRQGPTFTIGTLARRSGVPVRTIRFYSDQGLLPPATITAAGYRRYTEDDLVRLQTIRTLRAAGFDLGTIRALMDRRLELAEAARLQIAALALQERTLRRQRRLLERALATGEMTASPERARALALLSSAERASFLRDHLARGIEGVPVDTGWWERFLAGAVEEMPEELDDRQLEAWVELAEMTAEPGFAEAVRRSAQPFWERVAAAGGTLPAAWQEAQAAILEQARQAIRDGVAPETPAAAAIVADWVALAAGAIAHGDAASLEAWWLDHVVEHHDPRLARYWELMAIIRGWTDDAEREAAGSWIVAAVRHARDARSGARVEERQTRPT